MLKNWQFSNSAFGTAALLADANPGKLPGLIADRVFPARLAHIGAPGQCTYRTAYALFMLFILLVYRYTYDIYDSYLLHKAIFSHRSHV